MDVDQLLAKLQKKFNYSSELLSTLRPIIINMTLYFGDEYKDVIKNAFLETPIGFCTTREEIENFAHSVGITRNYGFPTFADAVYNDEFQLDSNNNIQKIAFIIIRADRGKDNPDQHLSTIVHELCHMVMNYGKSTIEGNTAHSKTGLSEYTVTYHEDGTSSTNEKYGNIEEGFNEYDARMITQMILGRTYESSCYPQHVSYVSPLMDDPDIRHLIDVSRLDGTNEWMKVLGEELSQSFIDDFDIYVDTLLNLNATKEEKKIVTDKAEETFKKVDEYMATYDKSALLTQ